MHAHINTCPTLSVTYHVSQRYYRQCPRRSDRICAARGIMLLRRLIGSDAEVILSCIQTLHSYLTFIFIHCLSVQLLISRRGGSADSCAVTETTPFDRRILLLLLLGLSFMWAGSALRMYGLAAPRSIRPSGFVMGSASWETRLDGFSRHTRECWAVVRKGNCTDELNANCQSAHTEITFAIYCMYCGHKSGVRGVN